MVIKQQLQATHLAEVLGGTKQETMRLPTWEGRTEVTFFFATAF